MQTSFNGLKFIQSFEGCVLHAYLDASNTPTIGWGMTYYPGGKKVTMEDVPLTQAQADEYFEQIVASFCVGVLGLLTITPTQNQLDALTDFAYNLGVGAFQSSTLLQHVNQNRVVESDFTIYDHIGKEVSVGLLARRKAEYELFTSIVNQSNNMEPTNTQATEVATEQMPQIITIKSISVVYDKSQNGQVTNNDVPVNIVHITPELIAALSNPDCGLIEAGYNIQVIAA